MAAGDHRGVIGGLWDEIGTLQADFLRAQGLLPGHALIDIGAGSFRAGVKLIPWLDSGNYHAIDLRAELLEAGYAREILPAGLADRFPRANFAATDRFDLSGFGRVFDFGLAHSVFTHQPLAALAACLEAVAPCFRPGGRLFATLFLAPEGPGGFAQDPGGITTWPDRDPFHATPAMLARFAAGLAGWRMALPEGWRHPRNQRMLAFTRDPAATVAP